MRSRMVRGRLWRECRGAEIAETAIVLPLVFLFVLGIFQFGRVFNIYSTVHRAAQEGARAASRQTCATCGSVNLTADVIATQFVKPIFDASHLDSNAATVLAPTMYSCTNASNTVPCDSAGTGATPKICVQNNVILNTSSGAPGAGPYACGTSVSVQYPYSFSLPSISASSPFIGRQQFTLNLKSQVKANAEE